MVDLIDVQAVSSERLTNIHLSIEEGTIVNLIGPSGGGKSSLLMLLNRLEDPLEGEILYKGEPITNIELGKLRRMIGLVQQTAALFEGTVEDNLKYGPSLTGAWGSAMGRDLLDQVSLPQTYLQKYVDELSGGEKQRVAFARALANKPRILLLDEVTSALDVRNVECIEQRLYELIESKKVEGMFMVTHDISQAKRMGSHTVFMSEGKIVEQGETKEILTHPETTRLKQFLKE
ncbi:ATP-binding cassette domain-containing protein [Texcoconibacillus texcoconensis]|uniref:Putative ABC transport system ATP-binding protein n=1 Tax=Texcoconibacillus texcoconensis TaxID=1095777 RepID=A0A840QP24_9BACI|nr:ATP-binding cassette domain-containing protein [Texcoconibacillus texcoconensis]MBB5173120.1 putative ABC transport system ATP-binding protein [Texcoconibacillus texcoconensis]